MKKLLFIFLFLTSYTTSVFAQALSVNTTRFVGGDSSCGYSIAKYSIHTRDGGILFTGFTDCFAGGGNIPPSPPDTIGATVANVLIGKLDSNMNVSWVKVYGGNEEDIGMSAVQMPDGGYAVLAQTYSNDRDVSGNHGVYLGDLWLVRLDSLGNLVWQKCYGSPYDEQATSIALAPDGGFIMLGISNGSGDEVSTHYGTEFNYNWFVVKADSLGNMQWSKTIGGTGDGVDGGESSTGSIFFANDGYYLVSSTNSIDYDCTDTFWHPNVNTGYDYYMFKLDTAGNILWDRSYGGLGGEVAYNAIWDDRDSSIVINGLTTGGNGYMVTGYNGGIADFWVVKTDKNGVLKWEKCLGGPNDDEGVSICTAPFGYMAYGSTNPGSIGHEDAWLFSLDTLGNEITNKQFGGANYDYPASVFLFQNGYAAVGYGVSDSFTEGINIGHSSGLIEDVFISYLNYWPLSIQNIATHNMDMTLYPNPSTAIIRIILPDQVGNITILNCVGESIYTGNAKQNETIDINTAGWASGLYIAKWQGDDGTVLTKKFIKN